MNQAESIAPFYSRWHAITHVRLVIRLAEEDGRLVINNNKFRLLCDKRQSHCQTRIVDWQFISLLRKLTDSVFDAGRAND